MEGTQLSINIWMDQKKCVTYIQWLFIGRTNAGAEASILWPPDAKSQLTGKDPDAGKDWRQEEKGVTEDEMLYGIIDSMDVSLSKFWETVKDREAWHAAVHGVTRSRTWLSNWTTTTTHTHNFIFLLRFHFASIVLRRLYCRVCILHII